jgi:hypothetical protein
VKRVAIPRWDLLRDLVLLELLAVGGPQRRYALVERFCTRPGTCSMRQRSSAGSTTARAGVGGQV